MTALLSAKHALTAAETRTIARAPLRCADEYEPILRHLAVIYLRGMCAMLLAQKRLSREKMADLTGSACSIANGCNDMERFASLLRGKTPI